MAKLELKRTNHPDSDIYIETKYPEFECLMTLVNVDLLHEWEYSIVWGDDWEYSGKDEEKGYAIAIPLALGCRSLGEYNDFLWGDPSADPYPEKLCFCKSTQLWLERIAANHNWDSEIIYRYD